MQEEKKSISALHARMVQSRGEAQVICLNNYKALVHIERKHQHQTSMKIVREKHHQKAVKQA